MKKLFGRRRPSFAENGDAVGKTLHKELTFTALEQYKLLRTNLDFMLPPDVECPIIGVTSSTSGEGKSTTAVNLSYVIAEKGSRVLLIDGDLRLPSVAKKMKLSAEKGLTDLLMSKETDLSAFRSELLENWYVIPSGEIPPNPSELLGSDRMRDLLERLRSQFDYIVIDLPPVNMVSDALSVSCFLTGMLVVVREEYTLKKELDACLRSLKLSGVRLLGCVMNASRAGRGRYGKKRKYGYGHDYGYGYGQDRERAQEGRTEVGANRL